MKTNIRKRISTALVALGTVAMFLPLGGLGVGLFSSCSPEEYEGADKNGLPQVGNADVTLTVDQDINQVTITLNNKEEYPIWIVDGKTYSTRNPFTKIYPVAGDYAVEMKVGNRNGFSDATDSIKFHFNDSKVDFTNYISRLTGGESRTWYVAASQPAHLACGESGSDGTNWWSAQPNEKADVGLYDDAITFTADGRYTYEPGDGGTVYVNKDCTMFPEYKQDADFMVPVQPQEASYEFTVAGTDIFLQLPAHTLFPYIANDSQWGNPMFKLVSLTAKKMELIYDNGDIAWRFIFVSERDFKEPFKGFKADSEFNLWKGITPQATFYFAPGWSPDRTAEMQSTYSDGGNNYTVTVPDACADRWQAQMHLHTTGVNTSAANHYDFSCIFLADQDIDGVTVKLTNEDDSQAIIDVDDISLKAGETFVFWQSDIEGKDLQPVKLVFDFGHAAGATTINVSDVVLKDHANDDGTELPSDEPGGGDEPQATLDWDYNSGSNLWKAVDDGTLFDAFGYYFADNGWGGIPYDEATHNDDTYELTLPDGLGGSQWQGQFHIDTKLTASAANAYNFYLVMEVDQDCPQVTFKLTDAGDTNFFLEERNDVKADEPFILKRTGLTLREGNDAEAIRLFFDFGGSPSGTHVKISKIYFEEVVSMNYDDADNLWKAVDDGTLFDAFGYYFADDGWGGIAFEEATHNGDTYELTLPEGLGGSQWQGQFHIDTKLTASGAKAYNFQLELEADNDCPGVTIKLTDAGDTNFFCEGRHDITADEPFVYTLKGATLKEGADASAIRLFFDFGGSPGGTHVKISKIVFKEA